MGTHAQEHPRYYQHHHWKRSSATMSSVSNTWQDRRALFQKGKEVHEPASPTERKPSMSEGVTAAVRRASVGSDTGLEKTVSNTSARRRSSNSALFGNLTNMKRGSVDYEQRRASHSEHQQSGGVLSGWHNQTFRGMQKPIPENNQKERQQRRGVME